MTKTVPCSLFIVFLCNIFITFVFKKETLCRRFEQRNVELLKYKDKLYLEVYYYLYLKNKCAQYWPGKDNSLEVGPCKMQLLKETTYAFYTCRKFNVQNTKVRIVFTNVKKHNIFSIIQISFAISTFFLLHFTCFCICEYIIF